MNIRPVSPCPCRWGLPLLIAALALCLRADVHAAPGAKVLELKVLPAALTLDNARDARRFVVLGRTPDGYWMDLTGEAVFRPAAPLVRRDADGFFQPVRVGATTMTITAGGLKAAVPVTVRSMAAPPVSFVRDVMPVLGKAGCNAGLCHGSAKGKNGFKLSLRGYDPDYDYHALTQDISGRRFNRAQPAQSLMLLKPTQGVPHQGGLVFEPDSRYYALLHRWIAEGVKSDADRVKRANRLEVLPDSPKMSLPGWKQPLIVLARYPDGTTRDVTRDAVFTSTMPETATVTPDGTVTAVRRGEAAILVRYEGNYAADRITVIGDRRGYRWAAQPQYNDIDRLVDAKLQRIKAVPSGLCTDAEFIRRVSLDIAGVPPDPAETRAFLADPTPGREKRARLVNRLLDSPDYADFWTNKWADLLQCNRKYLGEKGVWIFRAWIRSQIASNRPYDQFVREIVTASGSSYAHPAASYWRVSREPNVAAEHVTQLFLGIRFSCNKCHDHPFERWTQAQYYRFAAYFGRVGFRPGIENEDETVVEQTTGEVINPRTNQAATAAYPYTFNAKLEKAGSRREALAAWLTAPENPYFAKSYVNRMWSYFFGKGIIDPVDDIRSSNPPVNPELLDALTAGFLKSGFDTKRLIRTLCASRTYQASIHTNRWNADDTTNFSHALPRRLTAEQLMDSLSRATGSAPRYPGVPEGVRAVQLPDPSVAAGGFLDLFGRPPRESPCECERASTVSLGQTLNLINGPTIADALIDPRGRIAALIKTDPQPRRVVEEMFLAALCRPPTEAEVKKALPLFDFSPQAVRLAQDRAGDQGDFDMTDAEARPVLKAEAAQDLMWALLNSPAFLFNR
jgi:hypothetical protein